MERYERLEMEISELPSQQYLNAAIQLSNGTARNSLLTHALSHWYAFLSLSLSHLTQQSH